MSKEKIQNGYLGREYSQHFKVIKDEYKDLFKLSKDLNKFCHKIFPMQVVHYDRQKKVC